VSGKLHFDVEPTDLCMVVNSAIETVREPASQQGVELKERVPDAPIVVEGSPVRLQQIVWNLLSNAVKFTESGGQVSVDVFERNGDARVVVTDTGIGIVPEFLPYVFDPFQQADGSTTRQHGGLGLGLAIVRRLAEMHGGWVLAESDGAGRGARFTFSIPTAISSRTAREKKKRAQESAIPDPVLIVEDSPDTLELLSAFFESRGCRVMTAASAKEALELAGEEKPGIIVSDIGMPEEDGYELLARLRRERGLEETPAIAISGYATEEDHAHALKSGFSAHLAKPVDLDELLAVIQKLNS
jgi:CheY-like chemotaxis protein